MVNMHLMFFLMFMALSGCGIVVTKAREGVDGRTVVGVSKVFLSQISWMTLGLAMVVLEMVAHRFGRSKNPFDWSILELVFAGAPVRAFVLSLLLSFTWAWVYVAATYLLYISRRFDVGFQWFTRRFDIEKKPLTAIGLVSAGIVTLLYWGVVLAMHL